MSSISSSVLKTSLSSIDFEVDEEAEVPGRLLEDEEDSDSSPRRGFSLSSVATMGGLELWVIVARVMVLSRVGVPIGELFSSGVEGSEVTMIVVVVVAVLAEREGYGTEKGKCTRFAPGDRNEFGGDPEGEVLVIIGELIEELLDPP